MTDKDWEEWKKKHEKALSQQLQLEEQVESLKDIISAVQSTESKIVRMPKRRKEPLLAEKIKEESGTFFIIVTFLVLGIQASIGAIWGTFVGVLNITWMYFTGPLFWFLFIWSIVGLLLFAIWTDKHSGFAD